MRSARVCRGLQLGWEPGRTCSGSTTRLEFDPRHAPTPQDWLSLTGPVALEVVGGEVFEDTGGALTALRAAMDWYPDDLWRYLVACDWRRIDQELPLMGRAADRGDDLGSRVIAARLVDATMHLGFLLCRAWPPYAKWRGTLFGRLPLPPGVALNLAHVRSGDPVTARLALATLFRTYR